MFVEVCCGLQSKFFSKLSKNCVLECPGECKVRHVRG